MKSKVMIKLIRKNIYENIEFHRIDDTGEKQYYVVTKSHINKSKESPYINIVNIGSRRNLRILRDAINKELNSEYNIALSRLCNKKDKVISGKKLKKEVEAK